MAHSSPRLLDLSVGFGCGSGEAVPSALLAETHDDGAHLASVVVVLNRKPVSYRIGQQK
jgi:hypothetical protein